MREIPHSYAKAPKRGFRPRPNALFKAFRKGFVSCCESKVPKGEKYKPYILKYKALILKQVPCIFCDKPCVFSGVLFGLKYFPISGVFSRCEIKDFMFTPKFSRLTEKTFRFQTMFYRFGKNFLAKTGVFVWCCYASFLYLQQTNPL